MSSLFLSFRSSICSFIDLTCLVPKSVHTEIHCCPVGRVVVKVKKKGKFIVLFVRKLFAKIGEVTAVMNKSVNVG